VWLGHRPFVIAPANTDVSAPWGVPPPATQNHRALKRRGERVDRCRPYRQCAVPFEMLFTMFTQSVVLSVAESIVVHSFRTQ
jgi:hypothetical protein